MVRLLSISALFLVACFVVLHFLFPLPDKVEYSTVVTDNKGEIIHAFLSSDEKWRMRTSLDEISPLLRKTIVRKEDRLFYYHAGVNPFSMARAFIKNIFHLKRTSGASTITMQVARALERRPRTYGNKLIEIFRAWQLEFKYNKQQILQLYCNLLPYGGNIEGVKAASLLYLQKDPDHLSLAEITALSIIPNRPGTLVPGKNNAEIQQHRDLWLERFYRDEVFTAKEISDAKSEPFEAGRRTFPKMAPHLARYLRTNGKEVINSTIDLKIQTSAENIVENYSRILKSKRISNAAVVIIENSTRRVVAYVGSADFYDTAARGQVDGVRAVRQPGSTLKPLLYALCIDDGIMTPKTKINDVQVNYDGYTPENFNHKFNGSVSMDRALELSLNIPAVKGLNQIGTGRMIGTLASCNFSQVRKDQRKLGLSLVLGGCGTTLLELTSLYSAFANEGRYMKPVFLSHETSNQSIIIASGAAVFMINDILSKVNRPDFPLNWQSTERMPKIAWKTGTSYGRRDAWSIEYNQKYTVGVWAGNFTGEGSPELSGADIATPLLFRIFNTIDYDGDEQWFKQPDDADLRIVCSETGLPPGPHCNEKITDFFIPGISASQTCQHMREQFVSADGKHSFCRSCMPAAGYVRKLFKYISPDLQNWMDMEKIAYEKVPPHNPSCEQVFRNNRPMILSPSNGAEYLISKIKPEPILLQGKAGNDVNMLHWYIDNQYYKSANSSSTLFFVPRPGPVKISCTDDKGRNRDIWINVRQVDL